VLLYLVITFWKEYRLTVFENSGERKTGRNRRYGDLHKEKLLLVMYALLTGPNQEEKGGWGMLQMWGVGRCTQDFGGSLRERRPRSRWKDTIKMDLQVGWGHGVD
jgi:hypothetical protein